jgi:transcriptional regulator with XRE-family HTH domain
MKVSFPEIVLIRDENARLRFRRPLTDGSSAMELCKPAGLWLRKLRENCGLSQRQLADKVGAEYYTFISQLETGRGRIPPDRYLVWATALKVEPQEFVRTLMSFYDPVTYKILFGSTSEKSKSGLRRAAGIHLKIK